jgi:hypothetical protein
MVVCEETGKVIISNSHCQNEFGIYAEQFNALSDFELKFQDIFHHVQEDDLNQMDKKEKSLTSSRMIQMKKTKSIKPDKITP